NANPTHDPFTFSARRRSADGCLRALNVNEVEHFVGSGCADGANLDGCSGAAATTLATPPQGPHYRNKLPNRPPMFPLSTSSASQPRRPACDCDLWRLRSR